MKVSIASYAFHGLLGQGKMDIFGYLESCKYRYRVDSADIWTGFFPTLDDGFIRNVKEALDERELVLANLCIDGPHLWEDDPSLREQHSQKMLIYLRVAAALGAKTVRIDAGGKGDSFSNEQFDYIVSRFREYAQHAHDLGFKIGPENHWGPEVNPQTMKRICEAVDHPAFGVLLHFRGNEGDRLMAPFAMHTHISWDITMQCLDESLTMLRDGGYQGYYGVEHHSGQNEYTRVEVQLARVRELLSRW